MSLSVSESVEPAVRVARGASYLLLQGIVINIMGSSTLSSPQDYFQLSQTSDAYARSTYLLFWLCRSEVWGFQLRRRGSLRSMSPQSRKGRPASSIKRFFDLELDFQYSRCLL